MNRVNWTVVVLVGVIVLMVLVLGGGLLGGMMGYGGYYHGGWGMMGPWMMGPWMMGGLLGMWLIPIAFLVLCVLGIVWAVRGLGGGGSGARPSMSCPSCGRGVQSDWKNCPYCGALLTK